MIRRLALSGVAAIALWCATAGAASADPFADVEVVDEALLADARGGILSANGVTFDLGAIITTQQNGQLALATQITWTPTGVVATHVVGDPYSGAAAAAQNAANALAGGGLAIADATGTTQIVHGLTPQSFSNMVITTASGSDFVQDIQVTLTLPGFETIQAGYLEDLIGLRLGIDAADMLAAAGRF